MKRKQRAIKEFDFSKYDFSDCVEITGDALYLINGGAEIENSVEAQANANVGDTVTNSKGETHTLTEADINWAKDQISNSGNQASAGAGETPETTTATENETSQNTACGGSEHKGSDNTYTVHKGDTLSKIVYDHNKKYGTNLTVAEVAKKNGIKDPNKIFSGQQINLGLSQTRETQKPTTKRSETFTANNQIINKDNGIRTAPEPYEISGDSPNGEIASAGKQVATVLPTQDKKGCKGLKGDLFLTAEIDLVAISGFEGSVSLVLDLDNWKDSGINFSGGCGTGLNIGVGVGGGYVLRELEGSMPIGVDSNIGALSVSIMTDDEGFNGCSATVGPGMGLSTSIQKSYTLSINSVENFFRGLRK